MKKLFFLIAFLAIHTFAFAQSLGGFTLGQKLSYTQNFQAGNIRVYVTHEGICWKIIQINPISKTSKKAIASAVSDFPQEVQWGKSKKMVIAEDCEHIYTYTNSEGTLYVYSYIKACNSGASLLDLDLPIPQTTQQRNLGLEISLLTTRNDKTGRKIAKAITNPKWGKSNEQQMDHFASKTDFESKIAKIEKQKKEEAEAKAKALEEERLFQAPLIALREQMKAFFIKQDQWQKDRLPQFKLLQNYLTDQISTYKNLEWDDSLSLSALDSLLLENKTSFQKDSLFILKKADSLNIGSDIFRPEALAINTEIKKLRNHPESYRYKSLPTREVSPDVDFAYRDIIQNLKIYTEVFQEKENSLKEVISQMKSNEIVTAKIQENNQKPLHQKLLPYKFHFGMSLKQLEAHLKSMASKGVIISHSDKDQFANTEQHLGVKRYGYHMSKNGANAFYVEVQYYKGEMYEFSLSVSDNTLHKKAEQRFEEFAQYDEDFNFWGGRLIRNSVYQKLGKAKEAYKNRGNTSDLF